MLETAARSKNGHVVEGQRLFIWYSVHPAVRKKQKRQKRQKTRRDDEREEKKRWRDNKRRERGEKTR